ncbi:MAG TPA: nucleotide-binding protein [Methanospirillum sp.]|nr:nucleotide-binding protein [Methanospirillum sp.]
MQIRELPIRPSILHLSVFAFFALLIIWFVTVSGDMRVLIWAVPTLICLLIIPMLLNYMSQQEYAGLVPIYEQEARSVKIREITESMVSKPIRIEGLVEEVRFKYLNRPHFIVGDRTGVIPVKMFTTPREDIRKGDVVVVLGQVIRRYIATGDPVINGVDIHRISERKSEETKKKQK